MDPDHQDVPVPQVNGILHDHVDAVDVLPPDIPPPTDPYNFRAVISGPLRSKIGEIQIGVFYDIFSQAQLLISKKPGCLASAGWSRYPDIAEMRLAIRDSPEWDWLVGSPSVRYEAMLVLANPLGGPGPIVIKGPYAKYVTSAVNGLRNEIRRKISIFDTSTTHTSGTQLRDRMDGEWLFRPIVLALDGVTSGSAQADMFSLLRATLFDRASSVDALCSRVGFEQKFGCVRPEQRPFG